MTREANQLQSKIFEFLLSAVYTVVGLRHALPLYDEPRNYELWTRTNVIKILIDFQLLE